MCELGKVGNVKVLQQKIWGKYSAEGIPPPTGTELELSSFFFKPVMCNKWRTVNKMTELFHNLIKAVKVRERVLLGNPHYIQVWRSIKEIKWESESGEIMAECTDEA